MNMREDSLKDWKSSATVEHLQLGCLQRIADALAKVSANYQNIIDEREMYRCWYTEENAKARKLQHRIAGLQGALTKVRNRRGSK